MLTTNVHREDNKFVIKNVMGSSPGGYIVSIGTRKGGIEEGVKEIGVGAEALKMTHENINVDIVEPGTRRH